MAALSDTMVQSALDTSKNVGSGIADAYHKGAALALQKEQNDMQKQQIKDKQLELENAKLLKWWDAFNASQNNKDPRARKLYLETTAPKMRDALGLGKVIPDDFIKVLIGSEENVQRAETLNNMYLNGEITREQLIGTYNDPVEFNKVPPTPAFAIGGESLGVADAAKTKINAEAQAAALRGQHERQQTEIASTGQQEFAKKTAQAYDKFVNDGGLSGIESRYQKLESVLKELKAGTLVTGKGITFMPYGASEAVLSRIHPSLKAALDDVQGAVNIKQSLGGQFTEKEALIQYQRAFDPRLPSKHNITKIENTLKELRSDIDNKVKTFREQGFKVEAPKVAPGAPPPPPGGGTQPPAAPEFKTGIPQFDLNPDLGRRMKAALEKTPQEMNKVAAQLGITMQQLQKALEQIK